MSAKKKKKQEPLPLNQVITHRHTKHKHREETSVCLFFCVPAVLFILVRLMQMSQKTASRFVRTDTTAFVRISLQPSAKLVRHCACAQNSACAQNTGAVAKENATALRFLYFPVYNLVVQTLMHSRTGMEVCDSPTLGQRRPLGYKDVNQYRQLDI